MPIPPFYSDGNTIRAVTWFKDNEKAGKIVNDLSFYFRMLAKYNVKCEVTESDNPGKIIYEDDYQIGIIKAEIR